LGIHFTLQLELSKDRVTYQPGENVGVGLISKDITTVMMPKICTRKNFSLSQFEFQISNYQR